MHCRSFRCLPTRVRSALMSRRKGTHDNATHLDASKAPRQAKKAKSDPSGVFDEALRGTSSGLTRQSWKTIFDASQYTCSCRHNAESPTFNVVSFTEDDDWITHGGQDEFLNAFFETAKARIASGTDQEAPEESFLRVEWLVLKRFIHNYLQELQPVAMQLVSVAHEQRATWADIAIQVDKMWQLAEQFDANYITGSWVGSLLKEYCDGSAEKAQVFFGLRPLNSKMLTCIEARLQDQIPNWGTLKMYMTSLQLPSPSEETTESWQEHQLSTSNITDQSILAAQLRNYLAQDGLLMKGDLKIWKLPIYTTPASRGRKRVYTETLNRESSQVRNELSFVPQLLSITT
eukprot:Blabericola_migrator_1__6778@NODE_342_length_9595_cov_35_497376_g275_i0_p4_GENE_NODE_342_length_9595_cov_35_497376_g275_i0NODE_342_length_9595_cov_35_497376_g275_i0_p4_ORF_typecomplete_len346_score40_97SAM_Ste50p/PF09235_10/0_38SAM_Ste50p/PF09235_10/6e03_NODE_342_length_9595_cov_35_497376_g275_i059466983